MHSSTSLLSPGRAEVLHRYAVALAFVAIMAFGGVQMLQAMRNPDGLDFPSNLTDLREGRSTAAIEKQLDLKMPSRAEIIGVANAVRFLLEGGVGDQVRLGTNGWLYLTEELRFEPDGLTHLLARVELLQTISQTLQKQGVTLMVVIVPDKARVYAQYLRAGKYPDYSAMRYQQAIQALTQHDVVTVDLLAPLLQARGTATVYYRTDTHWNQIGAQTAALAIAKRAEKLPLTWEPTPFETTVQSSPESRTGDLIRLMGLETMPSSFRPHDDLEAAATTRQLSAGSSAGLFVDTVVPVSLVGTSYSLRGNFHGYLQQALSAQVLNSAKDGGGMLQAAAAYFKDESFVQSKPKLLIWELPERFLYDKLDWEPNWLSQVGLRPPSQ